MSFDESLIKDGEIREANGYWYAVYEFQSPLSQDQEKVAKRALLYRFMEFLENSKENEFYHKIIVHRDYRQVPDFLGRNQMHLPCVGLMIEKLKGKYGYMANFGEQKVTTYSSGLLLIAIIISTMTGLSLYWWPS